MHIIQHNKIVFVLFKSFNKTTLVFKELQSSLLIVKFWLFTTEGVKVSR